MGLLVTGAKSPFLRRADRLSRAGRRVLERELIAQVSTDGVTREQAFQYRSFVLKFALLGMAASASMGTSLAPNCVERIGRMSRFLSKVSGIGGVPPCVADGDGGRALGLSDNAGRQAAEVIVAGALAAGETPTGSFAAGDLAPALWFFGPDAVDDLAGRCTDGRELIGGALPDERFSGTLGFVTERESGRETMGLDVTEWTKAGSDVIHEPVANILFGRGTRGARPRC
ncbi:hypothetical protein KAW64_07435 [bacterium]|nr:hypothetical protein [bacterium]